MGASAAIVVAVRAVGASGVLPGDKKEVGAGEDGAFEIHVDESCPVEVGVGKVGI